MPNYSYLCNSCNSNFELFYTISKYIEKPKCPVCKSTKTNRDYELDIVTQFASVKKADTELKTIGDLAKRNTDRMSDDQKHSLYIKHNSYKEQKQEDKPLPKGMTYKKKPPKPKWPG
jgi:putative FmdB family regulatory protein